MPSKEKIVSPGVFTTEIDQSFLPAAIAEIGAVVVGPTVKGPAGIPTIVESYSEFQARFGDTFKSGSDYYQYLTSHTAKEYLKHANKLTVVRVLAGSYGGASATISSSVDPADAGGGTKATGSFTIAGGLHSNEGVETSMSIGGIDFILTGSTEYTNINNSKVYVLSSSAFNVAAQASEFASVINTSQSVHI